MGLDLAVRPWSECWSEQETAERHLRAINGALAQQGLDAWMPAAATAAKSSEPQWRARVGNYHALHVLREFAEQHNDDGTITHLLDHSDCDGVYIPVRFTEPLWIPMRNRIDGIVFEPVDFSVGSSLALLDELNTLGPALAALLPDRTEIRWGLRLGPHGQWLSEDNAEEALGGREATILHVARVLHHAALLSKRLGSAISFC